MWNRRERDFCVQLDARTQAKVGGPFLYAQIAIAGAVCGVAFSTPKGVRARRYPHHSQ